MRTNASIAILLRQPLHVFDHVFMLMLILKSSSAQLTALLFAHDVLRWSRAKAHTISIQQVLPHGATERCGSPTSSVQPAVHPEARVRFFNASVRTFGTFWTWPSNPLSLIVGQTMGRIAFNLSPKNSIWMICVLQYRQSSVADSDHSENRSISAAPTRPQPRRRLSLQG
jgi:hypothetical protein